MNSFSGNVKGSGRSIIVATESSSAGRPATRHASPSSTAVTWNGMIRPGSRPRPERRAPARPPPLGDRRATPTALAPTNARGSSSDWTVAAISSSRADVGRRRGRGRRDRAGHRRAARTPRRRSPRRRRRRPGASTATPRTASSDRGEQRERHDQPRALVDAAVGEDLAVLGELELAPYEPVGELAGLDGERADVPGDLLGVLGTPRRKITSKTP